MANKSFFRSIIGKLIATTDTVNYEGNRAYGFSPKHALAQYAATGCLNSTFYASKTTQLNDVLNLCQNLESDFIAKTAVYCREKGYMKDMPALLCAVLSTRADDKEIFKKTFGRVIDNTKMLRNFVQIMRSGVTGRKSLGSLPKRMVLDWIEKKSDEQIFNASVGNDPSMADILKMVHPRPSGKTRAALYGYILGRTVDEAVLPEAVKEYEAFKRNGTGRVPNVPFEMLSSLKLGRREWTEIAANASWQTTRMNLNTFARNGVFGKASVKPGATHSWLAAVKEFVFKGEPAPAEITDMDEGAVAATEMIAQKLADKEAIRRSRVFPYQLMAAYMNANDAVPARIKEALAAAMETATENVPAIEGKVYVFPDVSGSMNNPVTGYRRGSSSAMRCVDVAALIAASVIRKNPEAKVIPFEHNVVPVYMSAEASIAENAKKLAEICGGGTNLSAPLKLLNSQKAAADLVIYVSDNQSWVDTANENTATMREWQAFKKRNRRARMVCIDIQPYVDSQTYDRDDIMNIGGFSDNVFDIVGMFAKGEFGGRHWVDAICSVKLN